MSEKEFTYTDAVQRLALISGQVETAYQNTTNVIQPASSTQTPMFVLQAVRDIAWTFGDCLQRTNTVKEGMMNLYAAHAYQEQDETSKETNSDSLSLQSHEHPVGSKGLQELFLDLWKACGGAEFTQTCERIERICEQATLMITQADSPLSALHTYTLHTSEQEGRENVDEVDAPSRVEVFDQEANKELYALIRTDLPTEVKRARKLITQVMAGIEDSFDLLNIPN